jgi:hypothetical protein
MNVMTVRVERMPCVQILLEVLCVLVKRASLVTHSEDALVSPFLVMHKLEVIVRA